MFAHPKSAFAHPHPAIAHPHLALSHPHPAFACSHPEITGPGPRSFWMGTSRSFQRLIDQFGGSIEH